MIKRECVPIFWDAGMLNNRGKLDRLLSDGYEVERVDELHSEYRNVLIYILKKETSDD